MKLALGTVQFGVQYGISNVHGIPSDQDIQAILTMANQHEVLCLDTAIAYGNSELRLGNLASKVFRIVTKFNAVSTAEELMQSLHESLGHLKRDSVYGYLAHNANNLIDYPELWNVLKAQKEQQKVQKIGYSLYQPEQLEKLLDLDMIPDLVQIPYSILDRKFEEYLPVLDALGTEVHVRSAFLQGLYFMDPMQLPEKLQLLQPVLEQFQKLCATAEVSAAAVALNYVYRNPLIHQVVIGVENSSQLAENMGMITNWQNNQTIFEQIKDIKIENKELLNPVNW